MVRRYELIKDILQQRGETMTLEEIYEKYIETYPQFLGISIEALKVHMKKRKDVFVYLIRNSTYGLIDWKYEAQDVIDFEKMTIVDLVQKYLEQHEVPKHSFEITEYVLQFYPSTNLTSIYTSMLDRKHRFKDFGNRFWGLHSKNYDSFISKQLPKFLHKSIREYWKKHPEATQFEIIEALATRYNIYPSQVQYSMQLFMTKSAEFKNN